MSDIYESQSGRDLRVVLDGVLRPSDFGVSVDNGDAHTPRLASDRVANDFSPRALTGIVDC